nr:uncharacterized protein LOC111774792 [Equus caballus]
MPSRESGGPYLHNAAGGLGFLLNPNAAGAGKQLLSCRHIKPRPGERLPMDLDSQPPLPPGLLVTRGLDPRLTVNPRVGKNR